MRAIYSCIVASVLGAVALSGCGDDDEGEGDASGEAGVMEVRLGEGAHFDMPASIAAGRVTLRADNVDTLDHQAMILRFHDGEDVDSYIAAHEADPSGLSELELVDFMGGVNGLEPGNSATSVQDLGPGSYALICFLGEHYLGGMFEPFEVTGDAPDPAPFEGDATIELVEFGFVVPPELAGGAGSFVVKNSGDQTHELGITRVAEGHTAEEIVGILAGEGATIDLLAEAGGMGGLHPGASGVVELALLPGEYVLLCGFPDPETRQGHYQIGMAQALVVGSPD